MSKLRWLLPAVLVAAVGCASTTAKSDPSAPKGESPATPTEGQATKTQAPTLADIPAELKHDGYSYYGLGNSKPMSMEAVNPANQSVMTGTQTITLKEIKDGKAVFLIERTGQLTQLGTQEITLEKDGLYVTANSAAKANHDLEMPAKLTPGTSWPNRTVVDGVNSVTLDSTFKVVGESKVKTKVGERTGLLITSTGKGTIGGQPVTLESQNWYVRDLGGVKSIVKIIRKGGQTETLTIQESN